ncbi:hypothetical protein SALBM217S_07574 [Streptomyces griseoloalbus]
MLADSTGESDVRLPGSTRMRNLPAIVVDTLHEPLDWPDATVVKGERARRRGAPEGGVRRAAALARQPVDEPRPDGGSAWSTASRSRCSRSSPAATGLDRVFEGAADFDLELLEHRTLDDRIQELVYRPTLH